MSDAIYFGLGVLFFLIAAGYVALCRRLNSGGRDER
jgi:hypothetical protein